jgi:transposase-like protein
MRLEESEIVKKAPYSEGFKEHARAKVFSRGDRTVQAVADELNISLHTLKNWMKKPVSEAESTRPRKAKRPEDWSPEERLMVLQDSHGLSGETLMPGVGNRACLPINWPSGKPISAARPTGRTVAERRRNCVP